MRSRKNWPALVFPGMVECALSTSQTSATGAESQGVLTRDVRPGKGFPSKEEFYPPEWIEAAGTPAALPIRVIQRVAE